ncbi:MAG: MFS transporter [Parvularculaceae bacterium]
MVGAIYIYSLGLFIQPIEQEYGWSRTEISFGLTLLSIICVLLAPFMGMIIDKLGARSLALPGMVVYCLAIASLSLVGKEVWMWWVGWFFVALGSVAIKPTVWAAAVSSYFSAGRGFAMAVALCGTGIGQALLPPLTNALVAELGWRAAYVVLGLGSAVIILPLLFFFFYDARESNRRKGVANVGRQTMPGLDLREGFASFRFIFLAATALITTTGIVGIVVHFVPILSAGGLDRTTAAAAAGVIGLASMTGRLATGFLLDRIDGRIIGGISYSTPIITCLLMLQFDGTFEQALVLAVITGLSLGAEIDVLAYLASRYFGLRNYGTLYGTIVGLTTLGGGVGPLIAGFIYDTTGGYSLALMLFIPAFLAAALMIVSLGRYPVFAAPAMEPKTPASAGETTSAVEATP